jgi:putative copper export protein
VLIAKLSLVALALAWGAAHRQLVRPRLQRGEAAGVRIGRSLLGESAVAMAVLLLAAVLVDAKPPPQPVPPPPAAASAQR